MTQAYDGFVHLGFSNRSISKWNESDPGIRKVQKVADYLGVPIEKLLE